MKTALKENKKLLKELIYEEVNGKPIYYKNYKLVIKGKKTTEEVMASSGLHALILETIRDYLKKMLKKAYIILTGEVGVKTISGYRALDIGIFDFDKIKPYLNRDKILPICPIIAIEIDTKAELKEDEYMNYIYDKANDLLNSGAEKVIWILTKPKIILIAQKEKSWEIKKWNDDIEVMENIKFNLNRLLKEVGI
jgi:Uma2 family endonuclease